MATIVTVHGTFAHVGVSEQDGPQTESSERQWWQTSSHFEAHLREFVTGDSGELEFVEFVWSGDNSEVERRATGSRLLAVLKELETPGENYCVVAHSHGGSVISSALVESAARGVRLDRLQKWITVGTPFVGMKKERFLFSRLNGLQRVMFIASLMLLFMFVFYIGGELFDTRSRNEDFYLNLAFTAAMMSLPFIVFYVVLKFIDRRKLFYYWPKTIRDAQQIYDERWLSLCHEDDEAVQGLRYLPRVRLNLFDKGFAVPLITMAAVFALPLIYLYILTSPPIMVGLTEFLKTKVYYVNRYEPLQAPVTEARKEMRELFSKVRAARVRRQEPSVDQARKRVLRDEVSSLREQLKEKRRRLQQSYPDILKIERARRFKRRFLQKNGKPCADDTLCGRGHDYRINSRLLYHVVTDELSSAIVTEELQGGAFGGTLRYVLPIMLVPVIFGILAVLILLLTRFLAGHVSAAGSRWLNRLTLAEIKRSAFGNDTHGEIATGVTHRPYWISTAYPFLPSALGDKITAHSNAVISRSLAKFRNAISTLAFSQDAESKAGTISKYLTWKELIHTSYFEVPEFRALIALAISQAEGFREQPHFASDPNHHSATQWLASLKPKSAEQT